MIFDDLPLVLAQDGEAPPPTNPAEDAQPQEQAPGEQPTGQGQQPQGQQTAPGFGWFLPLLLLILVVMWVFMISNQRREKKKRQEMLNQIQKGSKVQTVGGIIGTVVDLREEEVILKVDENANTRLRFARSAIQSVLDNEESAG